MRALIVTKFVAGLGSVGIILMDLESGIQVLKRVRNSLKQNQKTKWPNKKNKKYYGWTNF